MFQTWELYFVWKRIESKSVITHIKENLFRFLLIIKCHSIWFQSGYLLVYRICFFHWPCIMRRRSLRLPSPKPFRNSDGNTGAFFRAENYQREFCVPKTGGLNVEGIILRVIFSKGLAKWSGIMMEFYGGIWNNAWHDLSFYKSISTLDICFKKNE